MRARFAAGVVMMAVGVFLFQAGRGASAEREQKTVSEAGARPTPARTAVERSLLFLEKDALKWRKERECATCHHGVMTVWALSEAKRRGYPVDEAMFAEMVRWTKDRFMPRVDQPRDPRPGWNLVSLPGLYLALMARTVAGQDTLSRDELNRIADHVARHQEEDGGWLVPPPGNGPPPVFESREILTLLAYLALDLPPPAGPGKASSVRRSRERAADWLKNSAPTDTTQADALRLLVEARAGRSAKRLQPGIDRLLRRQNPDGGWGQIKALPSDAFATGQALSMLSLAGVKSDRPEVQRGVSFLLANQREDGSWSMTSRAQPGAKPFTNPVPITYFGSAWASLGLMRSSPK
jgi:hypothetical protein